MAAYNDSLDVAQLLLEKGAEVNEKNDEGMTPLHSAAQCQNQSMTELLLINGADPNAEDNKGQTRLHWAAAVGDSDVAELLLAKGANIDARDKNGKTPLHMAVQTAGQIDKLLRANEAVPNSKASPQFTCDMRSVKNGRCQ